ncbi:MAG: MBL fold metallo-hydrolase [gamma proteobacterium endosymbiont of Lamellibrachia anaximandri]|nr:MBL fold metallo-hydrolase [gamma proteobacterium endosymbiont of Lamellibrachia anaximandri]MBL3617831.1 MBL fold metallo-hydrolase [gamma proteobacterium endosymbiont of Lamellibrachia anaximandri]
MRALIIPVTDFQQNCTLLWCEKTQASAIVDPGGDIERIVDAVSVHQLKPQLILITHGHIDHAGGAAVLARKLDIPIEGPQQDDRFWLEGMPDQAAMFGFSAVEAFEPDRWLKDGDHVSFGEVELEVLHCPGHTPGHVVFFHRESEMALVGDVLFHGSIGRTDFPQSNHAALIRSIKEKLWPLGSAVRFIPGHGSESTFGEERRNNPFVAD